MMRRSMGSGGRVRSALGVMAVALMALLLSPAALAQRMHGGGGAQWGGHAGGFHPRGGFAHGHNRGHFGSVVVIGGGLGFWYPAAYPYPYYAYPAYYPYAYPAYDASVAVPAYNMPPPVQSWYYCDAAGAYYPYVASCPGGWREVPATPPAPAR